ncbi:MAG: ABC transporter permease [Candidatus Methylacidiphilales bacterium]|nr:ABC transporter permease [Candidatus Methylacidiphilales bacterium]
MSTTQPLRCNALASITLLQREIVRFLRQKNRVIGALATPVVFWLLLGFGVGNSFRADSLPGQISYLEYYYPGMLVMIVLFTAIFSTISIIEDRREGFLQSVLVAPVSRASIVLGKVLGGAALATLQAGLMLVVVKWAGYSPSLPGFAKILLVIVLLSMSLTALGYLIAWPLDSTAGFHAIMNIFLLPLWLLSGTLFSQDSAQGLVYWMMKLNPLTYGLAALRYGFYPPGSPWLAGLPPEGFCYLVTVVTGLVLFAGCFAITLKRPGH